MQHYNLSRDMVSSSATISSSLSAMQSSISGQPAAASSQPSNLSLMRGLFEELAQFNQRIATLLAQHDAPGGSHLQGLLQQQSMPHQFTPNNESALPQPSAPSASYEPDPRKRTHTQFSSTTSTHVGIPVSLPVSAVSSNSAPPSSTDAPNQTSITANAAAAALNAADDQAALILFDASIRPLLLRNRPQLSYGILSQMIKDQWVHLIEKEKDVYREKARLVLQQEEEKEAEKKRQKEEKKRLTKKMKTAVSSNALAQSLSAATAAPNTAAIPPSTVPSHQAVAQQMQQPAFLRMQMNPSAAVSVNHPSSAVATTATRVSPARPPHPRGRGHLHVSVSDGSSNAIIQVLDTYSTRGISGTNANSNLDDGVRNSLSQAHAPLTSPSSAGSGDSPPDPSARSISIQPMPISSFNGAHNNSLILPSNAVSAATGGLAASSSSSALHTPSLSYLAASPMMLLPSPNSAAPSPATVVPSTLTHAALPIIPNTSTPNRMGIVRPKAVHLNASPDSQTRSLSPKRGAGVAAVVQQQSQQRSRSMENELAIHAELRTYVSPARNKTSSRVGLNNGQLSTSTTNMLGLNSSPSPLPPPPNDSPATSPMGSSMPPSSSTLAQLQPDDQLLGISPRTSPTFNRTVSMPSTSAETASVSHHQHHHHHVLQLQTDYDLGLSRSDDEIQQDDVDDSADPPPVRMMDTSPMSPVQEGP